MTSLSSTNSISNETFSQLVFSALTALMTPFIIGGIIIIVIVFVIFLFRLLPRTTIDSNINSTDIKLDQNGKN